MATLIDTNVVSELMRVSPNLQVINWTGRQSPDELYVSAVSVGELLRGILRLPAGRRRNRLLDWWERSAPEALSGGVLPFDDRCARV